MFKKRILLAIVSFVFFTSLCTSASATPILSIGDYQVMAGETCEVGINFDPQGEVIDFFGFRVLIAPIVQGGLEFSDPVGFTVGGAISDPTWFDLYRNDGSEITATYTVWFGEPEPLVKGDIFSITLEGTVPGEYDLTFLDVEFGRGFTPTDVEVNHGRIQISELLIPDSPIEIPDSQPAPVPEPATIFLLGSGLMGFGVFRKRR